MHKSTVSTGLEPYKATHGPRRASDAKQWPAGPDRNAGRAISELRSVATAKPGRPNPSTINSRKKTILPLHGVEGRIGRNDEFFEFGVGLVSDVHER